MARPAFVAAIDFYYYGVQYSAGDAFGTTGLNDLAVKRLLDKGYITAAGGGGGGGGGAGITSRADCVHLIHGYRPDKRSEAKHRAHPVRQ